MRTDSDSQPDSNGPRVSVGVMAHNEEPRLAAMLDRLREQTLLAPTPGKAPEAEVVIVANACVDATADVAREFIEKHDLGDRFRVIDIPERGKTNAWNRFVREFSSPSARTFVLADADIGFLTEDTLEKLVKALDDDPTLEASCGDTLKDLILRRPKNLMERFSAAFSRQNPQKAGQALICGQLYAIRADRAREIHLPLGLVADDGYLRHLLISDGFRDEPDPTRIGYVPGVGNVYFSYQKFSDIIATQVRMKIGEIQIYVLIEDVRRKLAENPDLPISEFQDEDLVDGPQWLARLLNERVRTGGWWLLHPGALGYRFRCLKKRSWGGRIKGLPLAVLGTMADFVLCWMANRKLKREGGQGDALWTQVREDISERANEETISSGSR